MIWSYEGVSAWIQSPQPYPAERALCFFTIMTASGDDDVTTAEGHELQCSTLFVNVNPGLLHRCCCVTELRHMP